MALIVMPVYDTVENDRTKYTERALKSLYNSVDWNKHRLLVVDNNSCERTKDIIYVLLRSYLKNAMCINLPTNIGTAEAWNKGAAMRRPSEHVIKIDNDIVINNCSDWVDQMEEVVSIDPHIGQVGLKRKDCSENVYNPNPFYKSKIRQLPHVPGKRWIIVEEQFHVMGSCVLHSSDLLDKIGFMYQNGLYGFDDSYMSARCIKAGFIPVMLPHIDIDHIDDGSNPYQKTKEDLANEVWQAGLYQSTLLAINSGHYYYDGITHQLK